jgi:hypothetical protein
MSLSTRITRIERSRSSVREPMVIVVHYPEPDMDQAEKEAISARAMAHAAPYLRGLDHNVIVEIEAGHIRLDSSSPTSQPLVCWCGQVHGRG